VEVGHPDRYRSELEAAYVLVDPAERRRRLAQGLEEAADRLDAVLLDDAELLEEVSDLVEWPGVVTGHFDAGYLDLPRELLITTLRHHQKCFSLQDRSGALLPAFLAVANTDRDAAGHIRRGNEWVVGGRLEDARFFWLEDRRRPLATLSERLAGVVFHGKVGSYVDKARRVAALAAALATRLGLTAESVEDCRLAASLSKNDLLTGTVGEFPELQGRVGGLMLAAEGASEAVWQGIYEHYQPTGPDDPVPATIVGRVASVADKLDSIAQLIAAGERPSGSRDPLGLRRAGNGIIRILLAGEWSITLTELAGIGGEDSAALEFLRERLEAVLRETGYTIKEILAVTRPRVDTTEANEWPLIDIRARLEAIKRVRGREDFRHLVKLTERVDNIVTKNAETIREIVARASKKAPADEDSASTALAAMVDQYAPLMESNSEQKCYDAIVHILSEFIDPVERFFTDCLVIDPDNPETTRHRFELLVELNKLFTRYFDIRELAGEAEGRVQ
jgi:glycyl-tRNA synthetase beta chain